MKRKMADRPRIVYRGLWWWVLFADPTQNLGPFVTQPQAVEVAKRAGVWREK